MSLGSEMTCVTGKLRFYMQKRCTGQSASLSSFISHKIHANSGGKSYWLQYVGTLVRIQHPEDGLRQAKKNRGT